MGELYKVVYEALGESLQLPVNNEILAAIIAAVIDQVAFRNAWNDVGFLYRMGVISGRETGSFFHWLIRANRYFLMWGVTYVVIVTIQFVMQYWQMIVCGLLFLMTTAAIVCIARHRLRAKRIKIRSDGNISEG